MLHSFSILVFLSNVREVRFNVRYRFAHAGNPSQAEAQFANETRNMLAPFRHFASSLNLCALNFATEPTIRIPALAARLLV
ncbi:hypothetical protein SAMN05421771_2042 [Granulicella pectinivorans]|uniref:Uncharacterized protein n=1 Tax=Granulicella pectinivorans TaxID=474950 RepID=A0A1I6M8C2_9BACT|nr:hypothetical protein SAMN05421771_2042 [Granulicella pectinivorans]